MPNFTLSEWHAAQARLKDKFQSIEMKSKIPTAMQFFLEKRDISIEGLKGLRNKETRPEEAYYKTRQARAATGASRNFSHTGVDGDSAKVDLTWGTFLDKFSISMKRYDNNLYSFSDVLAQNMMNVFINIKDAMDTAALTYLDVNKTTANLATKLGSFGANDVWETTPADDYFRNGKSMMRQNFYSGGYNVLVDPIAAALAEKSIAQGGGNATNLGYQFSGLNVIEHTALADANYTAGLGYWFTPESIAALDWIPKQNLNGFGNLENATKDNPYFTSIVEPFFGLRLAVHIYKEGADTSGTNGSAQDVVWQYEFSIDMSLNHAPMTLANTTPILAAGIV